MMTLEYPLWKTYLILLGIAIFLGIIVTANNVLKIYVAEYAQGRQLAYYEAWEEENLDSEMGEQANARG